MVRMVPNLCISASIRVIGLTQTTLAFGDGRVACRSRCLRRRNAQLTEQLRYYAALPSPRGLAKRRSTYRPRQWTYPVELCGGGNPSLKLGWLYGPDDWMIGGDPLNKRRLDRRFCAARNRGCVGRNMQIAASTHRGPNAFRTSMLHGDDRQNGLSPGEYQPACSLP